MMDSPSEYVVDANIFIDLHSGDVLKELFKLGFSMYIPDIVCTELIVPPCDEMLNSGLHVVTLSGYQVEEAIGLQLNRYPGLSIADLFVLLVARDTDAVLLTGERLLRRIAESYGLTVHGTLWVLEQMVQQGILESRLAGKALRKMLEQGSRFPSETVRYYFTLWDVLDGEL